MSGGGANALDVTPMVVEHHHFHHGAEEQGMIGGEAAELETSSVTYEDVVARIGKKDTSKEGDAPKKEKRKQYWIHAGSIVNWTGAGLVRWVTANALGDKLAGKGAYSERDAASYRVLTAKGVLAISSNVDRDYWAHYYAWIDGENSKWIKIKARNNIDFRGGNSHDL
jgi:hypothetical protein